MGAHSDKSETKAIFKEDFMNGFKKGILLFLAVSLIVGNLSSNVLAFDKWTKDDSITDEWNVIDLVIARPLGVAAGIIGTGIFILSLPFTLPTKSTDDAAKMFIIKPFKFSFDREFPDENM